MHTAYLLHITVKLPKTPLKRERTSGGRTVGGAGLGIKANQTLWLFRTASQTTYVVSGGSGVESDIRFFHCGHYGTSN